MTLAGGLPSSGGKFAALLGLNAGGKGSITTIKAQYPLTWVKTGNKVALSFSVLPIVATQKWLEPEQLGVTGDQSIVGDWVLSAAEFTLVDEGKIASTVVWQQTNQFVPAISNPNYKTYGGPVSYTSSLINLANTMGPIPANLEGTWLKAWTIKDREFGNNADSIQFGANSSAASHPVDDPATNTNFGWQLANNTLALSSIGGHADHTATMYFIKDRGVGLRLRDAG
jgi:hypothetical protein